MADAPETLTQAVEIAAEIPVVAVEQKAEEAKTASAVVNPYPHNSKERDLFNEGFFAGYLKDSEAEKYRRLVEAANDADVVLTTARDEGVRISRLPETIAELRSALDALREGK